MTLWHSYSFDLRVWGIGVELIYDSEQKIIYFDIILGPLYLLNQLSW
jgi:hypothetical protein